MDEWPGPQVRGWVHPFCNSQALGVWPCETTDLLTTPFICPRHDCLYFTALLVWVEWLGIVARHLMCKATGKREGGGGGLGRNSLRPQNGSTRVSQFVNFVFSHDSRFGLGAGDGVRGGGGDPSCGCHSNVRLVTAGILGEVGAGGYPSTNTIYPVLAICMRVASASQKCWRLVGQRSVRKSSSASQPTSFNQLHHGQRRCKWGCHAGRV